MSIFPGELSPSSEIEAQRDEARLAAEQAEKERDDEFLASLNAKGATVNAEAVALLMQRINDLEERLESALRKLGAKVAGFGARFDRLSAGIELLADIGAVPDAVTNADGDDEDEPRVDPIPADRKCPMCAEVKPRRRQWKVTGDSAVCKSCAYKRDAAMQGAGVMAPNRGDIARRRKQANLSQIELAELAGISQSSLSRLENLTTIAPSLAAARVYGVLEQIEGRADD